MQMSILKLNRNMLVGTLPDSWEHLTSVSQFLVFLIRVVGQSSLLSLQGNGLAKKPCTMYVYLLSLG